MYNQKCLLCNVGSDNAEKRSFLWGLLSFIFYMFSVYLSPINVFEIIHCRPQMYLYAKTNKHFSDKHWNFPIKKHSALCELHCLSKHELDYDVKSCS